MNPNQTAMVGGIGRNRGAATDGKHEERFTPHIAGVKPGKREIAGGLAGSDSSGVTDVSA